MSPSAPIIGPVLETERLTLTPFAAVDIDELHALFTDAGVRRYLLDDLLVEREWVEAEVAASIERFHSGSAGLWSARLLGGGELVGFTGYRPFFDPPELQLLYGLLPRHWGLGLATEAATAAITYAVRELAMDEVRAAVDLPNTPSILLLERLGMQEWNRTDEGEAGTLFYRLDAAEWETTGRR